MAGIVTPKFLPEAAAKLVVELVLGLMFGDSPGIETVLKPKRKQCHVVILVPSMPDDRPDYLSWPDYTLDASVLYEKSHGKASWGRKYDEIARCKALQLWHGRNDGGTDCKPHLLFPGDTPYWGGVKRDGIVVACSGVEPWLDRLISSMIVDMLIAAAYHAYSASRKPDSPDFLD